VGARTAERQIQVEASPSDCFRALTGDGTTLATYSLRIDPGVWMPGPLAKALNDQVMRRSVEDLKARVEDGA